MGRRFFLFEIRSNPYYSTVCGSMENRERTVQFPPYIPGVIRRAREVGGIPGAIRETMEKQGNSEICQETRQREGRWLTT